MYKHFSRHLIISHPDNNPLGVPSLNMALITLSEDCLKYIRGQVPSDLQRGGSGNLVDIENIEM